MKIALVSSEVAPFAKTGGLGDVVGALARWLHRAGHDVRTFVPLYGNLKPSGQEFRPVEFVRDVPVPFGGRVLSFSLDGASLPGTDTPVHFVRCPALFGRAETYSARGDEHLRFAMLSRASIESCQRMGWAPDVFHCHDWHAGLVPLYLLTLYGWDRLFHRTRTLLTIHNVGYQGNFRAGVVPELGLTDFAHLLHQDHLREGRIGFLETGILYADALSTVSETHAREIQGDEYGMGLGPLLRARSSSLVGIVNGIDSEEWCPERDPMIPARFSRGDLSGKARCRADLLASTGLSPDPAGPVLAVVSRLTAQKGFDLLFEALPEVLAREDVRFVALGTGESRYARFFEGLARDFPSRAHYREGYSNEWAHRIEAGADAFLMPSRYEPCGLNQMFSLRYGTVPVVRKTGGLADTVRLYDPATGAGTGVVFDHFTADGMRWALSTTLSLWRDRAAWRRMQGNGMAEDWSWDRQIRAYAALYAALLRR